MTDLIGQLTNSSRVPVLPRVNTNNTVKTLKGLIILPDYCGLPKLYFNVTNRGKI